MYTQVAVSQSSVELSDPQVAYMLLQGGDKRAFEILVQKYSAMLFNYVYRLLNNYEQASDVLQEVFIRCYEMLPSLHKDRPFKPWLFQVAHNYCIDELRKKHTDAYLFSELTIEDENDDKQWLYEIADPSSDIEAIHEHHTLQECLHKAINMLPVKQRAIVILRYTSNMRFAEIGQVLSMPEPTVKMYFYRAKFRLRKILTTLGIMEIRAS